MLIMNKIGKTHVAQELALTRLSVTVTTWACRVWRHHPLNIIAMWTLSLWVGPNAPLIAMLASHTYPLAQAHSIKSEIVS